MLVRAGVSVFDATRYLEPYARRRVRRPVCLSLTDQTYPPGERLERSWVPIAFRAFSAVAALVPVRDVLIIGTGNGLDCLGALEIFDLDSLTATDLSDESLAVARQNVLSHMEPGARVRTSFHSGHLWSCLPPDRRFCLVYENLPNIPLPAALDLGDGFNAASFFAPFDGAVPEPIARQLLTLHYQCLRDGRQQVREGGGVLTSIGGRIPLESVLGLHRACGYDPRLVEFDLKVQSEPDAVIPEYCRASERNSVEFTFYAREAFDIMDLARRSGLQGAALAAAVEGDLAGYAISCHEALKRHRDGEDVLHSVFMVLGVCGRPVEV